MSKKKKKSGKSVTKKQTTSQIAERLGSIDAGAKVSQRVNAVIEKMTAPPETIIDHLNRVGVQFTIDEFSVDGGERAPYVVFRYDKMIEKELANIKSGGVFKDEYPVKSSGDAKQDGLEVGKALKTIIDEVKRRGWGENVLGEAKGKIIEAGDGSAIVEPSSQPPVQYFGDQPNNEIDEIIVLDDEDIINQSNDNDDDGDYPLSSVQG